MAGARSHGALAPLGLHWPIPAGSLHPAACLGAGGLPAPSRPRRLTLVPAPKPILQPQAAERTITSDLEYLISKAVDTSKADYAVFTGVQASGLLGASVQGPACIVPAWRQSAAQGAPSRRRRRCRSAAHPAAAAPCLHICLMRADPQLGG